MSYALAQEVRGVETKRTIYHGESYEVYHTAYSGNRRIDSEQTEYIGFMFTNLNSISVSVSIEVYRKDNNQLIDTKDIVLKPNESYVHKYPELTLYRRDIGNDMEYAKKLGQAEAERYYVKYKAYKLQ